jgi:hypothetical protein
MAQTFFYRVRGAALLDAATYEEVEADRTATPQALAIVLLSSLGAGIGIQGARGTGATFAFFALVGVVSLLAWAAFALVTFEIGARILPTSETRVTVDQLLRTLGFAAAPGLIQVFGVFPGATYPVFALAIGWSLVASVIAVRQALDFESTPRAIAVCALAWGLSFAIAVVFGFIFGPTVSGFGPH